MLSRSSSCRSVKESFVVIVESAHAPARPHCIKEVIGGTATYVTKRSPTRGLRRPSHSACSWVRVTPILAVGRTDGLQAGPSSSEVSDATGAHLPAGGPDARAEKAGHSEGHG